ncbi:MAG: hypothetical protein ACTSUE_21805 [Promethearchaeota archaeon]
MSGSKNFFKGLLFAIIAAMTYVVLPYTGLTVVKNLDTDLVPINYARFDLNRIIFFIQAIGIIQIALAFAKGSSPKYSKRKALFALAQIIGSGTYIYIIKFSGLSQVPIVLEDIGEIIISFDNMMYLTFGVILVNGILALFDIVTTIKDQRDGVVYDKDKEWKETMKRAKESGITGESGDMYA